MKIWCPKNINGVEILHARCASTHPCSFFNNIGRLSNYDNRKADVNYHEVNGISIPFMNAHTSDVSSNYFLAHSKNAISESVFDDIQDVNSNHCYVVEYIMRLTANQFANRSHFFIGRASFIFLYCRGIDHEVVLAKVVNNVMTEIVLNQFRYFSEGVIYSIQLRFCNAVAELYIDGILRASLGISDVETDFFNIYNVSNSISQESCISLRKILKTDFIPKNVSQIVNDWHYLPIGI